MEEEKDRQTDRCSERKVFLTDRIDLTWSNRLDNSGKIITEIQLILIIHPPPHIHCGNCWNSTREEEVKFDKFENFLQHVPEQYSKIELVNKSQSEDL